MKLRKFKMSTSRRNHPMQVKKEGCSDFVELILEIFNQVIKEQADFHRDSDQDRDQDNSQDSFDDESLEKLLNALGHKALSAAQLMNKMGFSHRPSFRKNYLNPALEAGLIERTIPDKPNSKNQKYRKKLN